MIRLKDKQNVIYDTNIIIYHCFPKGKYNIKQYSNPAIRLTEFLFDQNSIILIPNFVILEIGRKGVYKIVNDYFSNIENHQKLRLYTKIRYNLDNLKQNPQFVVEDYMPSNDSLESINDAYAEFSNLSNINEYFCLKKTNNLNPSLEDKMLILFSKDKESPIVSNDLDLIFFRDELIDKDLVHEIIDFNSISSLGINS